MRNASSSDVSMGNTFLVKTTKTIRLKCNKYIDINYFNIRVFIVLRRLHCKEKHICKMKNCNLGRSQGLIELYPLVTIY